MRVPHLNAIGWAAWIPVLLLGAAAGFMLLHRPGTRNGSMLSQEIAGSSPLSGSPAALMVGAGISAKNSSPDPRTALAASTSPPPASDDRNELPFQTRSGAHKAGPSGSARSISHRSPLERSPGYYPPADPESLSVLEGRRDAPAVSLELTGGAASLDALGAAIVAALHNRDAAALNALLLTRKEFETICWREFPESRPVTNITAEDAWSMSSNASRAGGSRMVGLYGGRDLELLEVDRAGTFPYRNFVRHHGVTLVVRDRGTGEILRIPSAPSWIERNGRFKVLIFKD